MVAREFLSQRIAPLQWRSYPAWEVTGAEDRTRLACESLLGEEAARALEVLFPRGGEVPDHAHPVYRRADRAELVAAMPWFDQRGLIRADPEEAMGLEDTSGTGSASSDSDATRSEEESSGKSSPPPPPSPPARRQLWLDDEDDEGGPRAESAESGQAGVGVGGAGENDQPLGAPTERAPRVCRHQRGRRHAPARPLGGAQRGRRQRRGRHQGTEEEVLGPSGRGPKSGPGAKKKAKKRQRKIEVEGKAVSGREAPPQG